MTQEQQVVVLDRVKYIAEHFDDLNLVELVTLFVATATLFETSKTTFYDSYINIMQTMVLAKQQGRGPHDAIKLLKELQ